MATKGIGSLALNLIARTKPFTADIGKARAGLGKFGDSAKSVGKSIFSLGGLLTGVSVGGLALFLNKQAQALDALAETADRLNISTEAFSSWEHYAAKAGVASGELEKALTTMNKNIGAFAAGGGGAAKTLEALHFKTRDLVNLRPEDMFLRLSDRIAALPTHAERAAAAMAVFGKAGAKMLPIIEQGAAGLKDMVEQGKALGIAFSRDQIEQVERFNDAMDDLKRLVSGLGQRIVIEFAPAVVETISGLQLLMAQYERIAAQRAQQGKEGAAGFIDRQFPWTKAIGKKVFGGVYNQAAGYWNDLFGGVNTNQAGTGKYPEMSRPNWDQTEAGKKAMWDQYRLEQEQLKQLKKIADQNARNNLPVKYLFADS